MIVAAAGVLIIVVAAIAAIAFGGSPSGPAASAAAVGSSSSGVSSGISTRPPSTAGPSGAAPGAQSQPAVAALPPYAPGTEDPGVGRPIPPVDGISFDGSQVSIKPDGRPKLILFLAHWCPHCQAEVPVVQAWLDADKLPARVDLITVSTSMDPTRPNYPPDAWLAREHWTAPVIVDVDGDIASSYGLKAFPYWVAVGSDGTVVRRLVGEMPAADLDGLVASLP